MNANKSTHYASLIITNSHAWIVNVQTITHMIDLEYGIFGSVFRSGSSDCVQSSNNMRGMKNTPVREALEVEEPPYFRTP